MHTPKVITSFLYNTQAEEAANFYVSVFSGAKIADITRYPAGGMMPEGTVLTAEFHMLGQNFIAINSGADFTFSEAFSLQILCDTQDEIDTYWNKLLEDGGKPGQCGWLKDRFGFSWQIVPVALGIMLKDKDPERAARVMKAMMAMTKLDLPALEAACKNPE